MMQFFKHRNAICISCAFFVAHIERNGGVRMIILCGNEPYLIDSEINRLKEIYNYKKVDCLDENKVFLEENSFFDTRKKAIFYFPEDGVKAIKKIDEYFFSKNLFIVIYENAKLNIPNVEIRRFNKLNEQGLKKYVRKVFPYMDNLLINKFVELSNYLVDESVTLYNILGEFKKIKLIAKERINEETLVEMLGVPSYNGDAFKEGKFLLENNKELAIKNAMNCKKGDELAFLGALRRFYRVGWKYNYFSPKEVGYGEKIDPDYAVKALEIVNNSYELIRTGVLPGNIALMSAIFKILNIKAGESNG